MIKGRGERTHKFNLPHVKKFSTKDRLERHNIIFRHISRCLAFTTRFTKNLSIFKKCCPIKPQCNTFVVIMWLKSGHCMLKCDRNQVCYDALLQAYINIKFGQVLKRIVMGRLKNSILI